MRVSLSWHFHTKYPISPSVLNNTVSLLNKDLLGFHLLELLNGFLGLSKLLTFIFWNCEIIFCGFATIEALNRFLSFLGATIESVEFFTFLVEGYVVEDTLAAEGWNVISSQKTGGFLALLVDISFLDLFCSGDSDESSTRTHISKNLRDLI